MRVNKDLRNLYQYVERNSENPTIKKIIFNENSEKYNYHPKYQRNYVWSNEKATRLIETILINGEIPPLTVTRINGMIEIIDGRQRYETILNFCNNKLRLKRSGLSVLTDLEGCTYKSLPENAKEIIQDYKLRMIVYSFKFGMEYPVECEEDLKRDLFRRFNSGMTSLSKTEVARASYAYDSLTKEFKNRIQTEVDIYNTFTNIFIPKTKRKLVPRELINLMLVNIRELLTVSYISIIDTPSVQFSSDIIDDYYQRYVLKNDYNDITQKFESIIIKIADIKKELSFLENGIADNILFYKAVYWMLSILYDYNPKDYYEFNVNKFAHYIEEKTDTIEYFDNYKNMTSKSIINRYGYMKEYINNVLNISIEAYVVKLKNALELLKRKPKKVLKNARDWSVANNVQTAISKETSFEISDIIDKIKKGKFNICPIYQREEVKSRSIASKIIESIILGIKLPPIYVYSKTGEDGITKYEVIDGQQRIISVLSFLDEFIINNHEKGLIKSKKGKFKLINLRNSEFINNKRCDEIGGNLLNKIKNYQLECIEIRENANTRFNPIDMFLRLNSKPYPIAYNSFEMWNSFDCVEILDNIKMLSDKHSKNIFKQSIKKMKNEELITTLAFLSYKEININNIEEFFKVYVYHKDQEIKMTFDKKYSVTALLENIEDNQHKKDLFIEAINQVDIFVKKLKILFDDKGDGLCKIFNPYNEAVKKVRAKDFYLLYVIMQELNMHVVETYKKEIVETITEIYKLMKHTPEDMNNTTFLQYTRNMINEYKKL